MGGEGPSAGICLAACGEDAEVCEALYPNTRCVALDPGAAHQLGDVPQALGVGEAASEVVARRDP